MITLKKHNHFYQKEEAKKWFLTSEKWFFILAKKRESIYNSYQYDINQRFPTLELSFSTSLLFKFSKK
jgi:hypothetical protein